MDINSRCYEVAVKIAKHVEEESARSAGMAAQYGLSESAISDMIEEGMRPLHDGAVQLLRNLANKHKISSRDGLTCKDMRQIADVIDNDEAWAYRKG